MSRYNVYNICFTRTSKKQFEALSSKIKKEITKILEEEIACDPFLGKPLHGALSDLRSKRIGNLLIICQIIKRKLVVMVINMEDRKQVYRANKTRRK